KRFINTLPPSEMEQMVRKAVPRFVGNEMPLSGDNGDYIARLMQPAQAASDQIGIPHDLILAQAALESGWGHRQILTRDGKPSFNLVAIKATGSWQCKTTEVMTTEYEGGAAKKGKQ
ncbi:glucosaminidase domain-containing protein, partial [Erwinia amylovora]|uniref:glucosaminidase domain-containing protein n=1 Tax=Erwinia amylovora TaxID=552 RepID=UPI00200ADAF8